MQFYNAPCLCTVILLIWMCLALLLIRVLHFLFFFGIFSYIHGLIRTYTFAYFLGKVPTYTVFYVINIRIFPPTRPYQDLHVYWFLRKPPTYTVIRDPRLLGTPEYFQFVSFIYVNNSKINCNVFDALSRWLTSRSI